MTNTQNIKIYALQLGAVVLKIAYNSIYNTLTNIVFIEIPISIALNKYENISMPWKECATKVFEDSKLYEVNMPKYLSRGLVSGIGNELANSFGVQDNLFSKLAIGISSGSAGAYSKIFVKTMQQEEHAGEVAVYSNQIIYEVCNQFEYCANLGMINYIVTNSNEVMESIAMQAHKNNSFHIDSVIEGGVIGNVVIAGVVVIVSFETISSWLGGGNFLVLGIVSSIIAAQVNITKLYASDSAIVSGESYDFYNSSDYIE